MTGECHVQLCKKLLGKRGGGYSPKIKCFLLTLLLSRAHCTISSASCGDIVLTPTVRIPTVHTNIANLPPEFTDVNVACDTITNDLCSSTINIADNTITLNTTTANTYTNLNDYNFLRSNKSIFPTFDNTLILTPTFVYPSGQRFGAAVAISGDGSTIAVGSTFVSLPLISFVNIYKRQGNTWVLFNQITRPDNLLRDSFGEATRTFGSVLALSYDGSILAVGSITINNLLLPCYVFMYVYNPLNNDYTLHQTIAGSSGGGFGQALALSADGKYLVVNDNLSNSYVKGGSDINTLPSAWVYVKSESCTQNCATGYQWAAQQRLDPMLSGNRIVPTLLPEKQSQYLAISADGNTIAMGCTPTSNLPPFIGAVVIFSRTNATWEQTQFIFPSSIATASLSFGSSVSLSGDGTYLAVGDPSTNDQPYKKVFIFAKRGSSYEFDATIFAPTPNSSSSSFGISVSLSTDGTVVAIGEGFPFTSGPNNGGIYIAVRGPNNRWTMPFSRIGATDSNLGYSVACSADGCYVVAGATGTNSSQGAAFVFSPVGSFVPNDTKVTGTLCVYQRTTINAPLHVAGNIHLNNTIVTGTGLVTPCAAVLSDTHTKGNITRLDPVAALEKLRSLQPITFFWRDATHNASSQQTGFIAQHMQEIFPCWVNSTQAADHERQWLDDDKKYMITIKAELYAYLIAALERLVQRNAKQKQAIVESQRCCRT